MFIFQAPPITLLLWLLKHNTFRSFSARLKGDIANSGIFLFTLGCLS